MEKNVLDSLWNKMCDVFATQDQVSAALQGKQDIMSAGRGISIQNNVISNTATEEVVSIVVSSEVAGFDPEGLVVSVYYNDADTVTTTVTLDEQGRGTLVVPHDYKYKLVFPSVEGCKDPAPVVHYSMIVQRSIEIEYAAPDYAPEGMQLTVYVAQATATGMFGAGIAGVDVDVTVDGVSTVYTTGDDGKFLVVAPFGKTVTVTVPLREGYDLAGARTRTFSATQAAKYAEFMYYVAESGIKIVANDGTEYSNEEFADALSGGSVSTEDAKLIKISTADLVAAGGVFYVSIDMLATRDGIVNKSWAGSNVQFYDIPLNGNSASAAYYYDGRTASGLIQDEGDRRNISTLAVDEALSKTLTLSSGTLFGFLGSVGQWSILWSNRYLVDEILATTRPAAAYNFSSLNTNKWTSTQDVAARAWSWLTSANYYLKSDSYAVVPFFAF